MYHNGGQFDVLNTDFPSPQIRAVQGLYGMYVLGDQVVLRWGDSGQKRHLGVFGAFLFVPDQRLNAAPYLFDCGLVGYGLVSSRPKDFAAMGVAYGSYTGSLRSAEADTAAGMASALRKFETTIEWTYGCVIRPGLVLQPSLQYIIHPKGAPAIPNAIAIGVNLVLSF